MSSHQASRPAREGAYHDYAATKPTRFFARRSVAAAVLALAVLFSSVLGCHRSLGALKPQPQDTRLEELLDRRADVGFNMVTVAENYIEDRAVKQVAEAATMLRGSHDAPALAEANEQLTYAAEQLRGLLLSRELSERDAAYLDGFVADLRGLNDQIRRDAYNDRANHFNDILRGTFPANVLGPLTGVTQAPVF